MENKLKNLITLAKKAPVLIEGNLTNISSENTVELNNSIPSTELAIINTENGLKRPEWFEKITEDAIILIKDIDMIDKYEQEKFYEILKYNEISNIALPKCSIVLTCKKLENVSNTILNLCQVIKGA